MKSSKMLRVAILAIAILALLSVSLSLYACGDGGFDTTTTEDTTPLEARNYEPVYNKKLGLTADSVESSAPRIADGNVLGKANGIRVVAYAEGRATLTVKDYFGRTATVDIEIGAAPDYKITVSANPCTDKSVIDVRIDYNANGTGAVNDTEAIQKAIDQGAAEGKTVFVPAGIYLIDKLELREGSNVLLQGKASDYIGEDCMNQENYNTVKNGDAFAVLRTTKKHKYMCINNEYQKAPTTGKSNISFKGGVIDMMSSSYSGGVYSFVFTCGDNITLEDTLMLDCYNEHTIQVSGCTNVTIKNCVFAGYVYGDTNREALQVEAAGKGCNGAATYPEDGSFKRESSDVLIEGCYFGPTPVNPAPPMGVGHHGANGYNGKTDCTNLTIKDCIFEKCGYAAIRQPNSENLVIEGNTFITDGSSSVVENPSCIDLYILNNSVSYTSGGIGITTTKSEEKYGVDAKITGNTFKIGGTTSNFRVLQLTGKGETMRGASVVESHRRVDSYGDATYVRRGFIVTDRNFHDIVFSNNKIDISARTTYNDAFITSSCVVFGFEYDGNEVTTAGSYSKSFQGNSGISGTIITGANAQTRTIKSNAGYDIIFKSPDGATSTVKSANSENKPLVLKVEGNGKIDLETDRNGKLYVSVIPAEGYKFDGWFNADGSAANISGTLNVTTGWTARFSQQ